MLCTRRIGDVLLTTPLIRALKRAWPQARIDALTLASSAAVLAGNPDLERVITLRERAPLGETLRAVGAPRAYDLALSTLYNDRPHLLAWWAAPRRANVVPPASYPGARWKRWLTQHPAGLEPVHTVVQYLRLADALGIARCNDVVPPRPADTRTLDAVLGADWSTRAYAVVHPRPLYEYKAWTLEGWRGLLRWLGQQGLQAIVTGGPGDAERSYAEAVVEGSTAALNAAGRFSLAELTPLLERARAFIGPDTSVTHLAAATGAPTVALFGPSNTTVWGPWPQSCAVEGASPWRLHAPLQHEGNVWIVQGLAHCVPCLLEGCERKLGSRSLCLDELPLARITSAVTQALRR